MALPVLDATEQRILGSLLEKQVTVPASYPLSLNALRLACNQSNSREPVMELDDKQLLAALRGLKDRGLVQVTLAAAGSRTLKYHQLLSEELDAGPREMALLTVLLLRGPQSAGELKVRVGRLHTFASKEEAASVLAAMAARAEPLAQELPAVSGRQDTRWIHLLGPAAAGGPEPAAPQADRESVLADGAQARDARVAAAYDAVAAAYAGAADDDLARKPFDRWLLGRIAAGAAGPVMDLGCGPGHIAAWLAGQGADVHGLDASPAMIACARDRFPDLDVAAGSFGQLMRPRTASGWDAIIAWFSLVHLAPSELAAELRSAGATLRPGGTLALALACGDGISHYDELFGTPVDLDVVQHDPGQVLAAAGQAGLDVAEWYIRSPAPGEAQLSRLYVLARRPQ